MSEIPQVSADAALGWLRGSYPLWRIWYVRTWDGARSGIAWCAERASDGLRQHADTPGHLAEYIAGADTRAGA